MPSPPTHANTLTEAAEAAGLVLIPACHTLARLLSNRHTPFKSDIPGAVPIGWRAVCIIPASQNGPGAKILLAWRPSRDSSPPSDIPFLRLPWALDHFSDFWEYEYMRTVSVWIPYLYRCSGFRFSRTVLGFHSFFFFFFSLFSRKFTVYFIFYRRDTDTNILCAPAAEKRSINTPLRSNSLAGLRLRCLLLLGPNEYSSQYGVHSLRQETHSPALSYVTSDSSFESTDHQVESHPTTTHDSPIPGR